MKLLISFCKMTIVIRQAINLVMSCVVDTWEGLKHRSIEKSVADHVDDREDWNEVSVASFLQVLRHR